MGEFLRIAALYYIVMAAIIVIVCFFFYKRRKPGDVNPIAFKPWGIVSLSMLLFYQPLSLFVTVGLGLQEQMAIITPFYIVTVIGVSAVTLFWINYLSPRRSSNK